MTATPSNVEHVLTVVPQVAPRPRFSKWGAYEPASYTKYKKELKALLPPNDVQRLGELIVTAEFVCKPIAKSKFTTPLGDIDNFAKPLMDVLTQAGWYGDDRQIVQTHLCKRFPEQGEVPHIRFHIQEIPQ
ncbi:RusA family crossover junction endodeoxyribonuclease [Variovorax sp. J22G73]|uniref:RusA family crossover junction endodeoxyribonuclease n=1 Tax=unclassified Variovorax TaxID=663243 RepID=UPI002578EA0A|nr:MULTISPECIES: RusA family crossover junction endodeoxyribonuclease [unclassified Variovorax]MDM0006469.1 RusA family crossover junction endodeoxyribonuclease [Variovorax sp. J22R203]MDM0097507.1 RusA family crossover junction endodeoxyribonuclease [Variovorax sp. J22G73]